MVEVEEYPRRDIKLRINEFDQAVKEAIIPNNFGVDYGEGNPYEDNRDYAGGLWSSKIKVHGIKVQMPITPDVLEIEARNGNKLHVGLKFKSSSKKYDFKKESKTLWFGQWTVSKALISGSTEVHIKELSAKVEFEPGEGEFGVERARVEDIDFKISIKKKKEALECHK